MHNVLVQRVTCKQAQNRQAWGAWVTACPCIHSIVCSALGGITDLAGVHACRSMIICVDIVRVAPMPNVICLQVRFFVLCFGSVVGFRARESPKGKLQQKCVSMKKFTTNDDCKRRLTRRFARTHEHTQTHTNIHTYTYTHKHSYTHAHISAHAHTAKRRNEEQ